MTYTDTDARTQQTFTDTHTHTHTCTHKYKCPYSAWASEVDHLMADQSVAIPPAAEHTKLSLWFQRYLKHPCTHFCNLTRAVRGLQRLITECHQSVAPPPSLIILNAANHTCKRSAWASEVDHLMADQSVAPPPAADPGMVTKFGVNAMALKRAWESSQRVTKEDWWVCVFVLPFFDLHTHVCTCKCHRWSTVIWHLHVHMHAVVECALLYVCSCLESLKTHTCLRTHTHTYTHNALFRAEWMRHFSVELLRESPSPALRACHSLALVSERRECVREVALLFMLLLAIAEVL